MEKMKALVFKDVGKLVLEDKPVPHVKEPDDVVIKVSRVGICGTDVKIMEGKHHFRPNTVLGHEFCGEIVEVGTHVHHVKLGDRVAVDNNIRCGFCTFCRMGLTSQCVEIKQNAIGVMRDGGYAEYCLVPEKQCYVLPDEIDDVLGSQVETLATVVNGMNHLQMLPYDYVLILGFGPIGYLFAQFAKNIAAKVAVTEIDPYRISMARECGLTVWNPKVDDIEKNITEFTYGRKADIVVEATGNAIEQGITRGQGTRFVVQLDNGQVINVVQTNEANLQTGDRVRIDLNRRTADILISDDELAKRRQALADAGGYKYPASQTPWQEIQRGIVDELSNGMVLKPAVKYQCIAKTKGIPRDNH